MIQGVQSNRIKTLLLSILLSLFMIGAVYSLFSPPIDSAASAKNLADKTQLVALVPSTPRDFILPGTQPNNLIHSIIPPGNCASCHANYAHLTDQSADTETWTAWAGSMMAQAGRDPLFFAALDVANADAAFSGEFCLRCHMPRGWLDGRSSPDTDGSSMTENDREGVQCAVCHRMVDPVYSSENPARDVQILNDLDGPVPFIGSSSMVIDPKDFRRGPFDVISDLGFDPHLGVQDTVTMVSPYHQEAAFCGTCHDINNPMFTWDEASQEYKPNPLDEPGDPVNGFPIERTFSEWRESAFNSTQGIYAPQFGGNKSYVSTCQDCHMRDVTGVGGAFFGNKPPFTREDMPLHDLTGANTWVPQIIPMHPVFSATFNTDPARADALAAGIDRARYMLKNAASLDVFRQNNELFVTVQNQSGHKLPSGYVEGRRMWLQIEGYNASGELIFVSGGYDEQTGILQGYHNDPTLKVYEAEQGLTADWAAQLGKSAGPSFHFALNNQVVNDNRIPPKGYDYEAFQSAGAAPYTGGNPDPDMYADGQFWDTTVYELPEGVVNGVVRLLYQTASKEYIEFLRENNPYEGNNNGEILYDLWQNSGRSRPELMAERTFATNTERQFLPAVQRP